MYSCYGSSSCAGGKRGHGGGRDYRPPPERRRDPQSAPPPSPLKECKCLLQCNLQEYQSPSHPHPRQHVSFFGGRDGMQKCDKVLRKRYKVHLVVPGRKQSGPIAIVGKTQQQVLAAADWLLQQIIQVPSNDHDDDDDEGTVLLGRIQRNVKNPQDPGIAGNFRPRKHGAASTLQPYWLFQSTSTDDSSLSVLACSLLEHSVSDNENYDNDDHHEVLSPRATHSSSHDMLATLQVCVDNANFRRGASSGLDQMDVFTDPQRSTAFAAGNRQQAQILYEEICKVFNERRNADE